MLCSCLILIFLTLSALCVIYVLLLKNSIISLILFRISAPTTNQVNRISEYEKQLPKSYKVVILTDICNNIACGVTKYCISRNEVITKYPEVKRMGGICRNKSDSFYMWMLHSEHYLMWEEKYKLKYRYLWIFDQDVVYTGNIYHFLKKYDNYDEDLITYHFIKILTPHYWDGCITEEYKEYISKDPIFTATHVHRLSLRMRRILNKQFLLKRHAQVEQMIIETAIYNNLTVRMFDKKDYDKNSGFNKAITNYEEYKKLFINNSTKNMLYHPVRY